jgi:hypothetical protein
MKFDRYDTPKVAAERVDAGPSGQLPISTSNPGLAVGRAIADLGEVGVKFAEEKKRAETYRSADAELRFAEEVQGLLYSSKGGYLTKQNAEALDTESVHERIEALRQKYAPKGLSKESAEEYDRRTRVRALSYKETVELHAAGQRKAIYSATVDLMIKRSKDEAVKNYTKPKEIEDQMTLATPLLADYLKGLHISAPMIEGILKEYEEDVYEAVLGAYKGNRQPLAGKKYLDMIRKRLGAKATAWDGAFGAQGDAQETERLSTEAWARLEDESTDPATKRFNPDLARAALVELYEPAVRTKIETEVEKSIATAVAAQREEDVQRLSRLSRGVRKTSRLDRQSEDFLNLDQLGKDKAEELEEARHRELRADDATARREQASLDSIAESQFYQIPTLEERAALTPEQIEGTYTYASQKMRERIKAKAVAAGMIVKKSQQASYKEFITRVIEIQKALPAKRGQKFRQKMLAWYDERIMTDTPITDDEMIRTLNERVRMRETWGANEYDFELDNPDDYDLAEHQPVARARGATARPTAATKQEASARRLPPPKPGKVWVERDGQVGQVSESSVRATDKRIK